MTSIPQQDCRWWYWGSYQTSGKHGLPKHTCMSPKRKPYRALCTGKCKLYKPHQTAIELLTEFALDRVQNKSKGV